MYFSEQSEVTCEYLADGMDALFQYKTIIKIPILNK